MTLFSLLSPLSLFAKRYLLIFSMPLFCLLGVLDLKAQTGVSVHGVAWDEPANAPLPMAGVTIEGLNIRFFEGKNTDVEGRFQWILPQGTYKIKISYVGYLDYIDTFFVGSQNNPLDLGKLSLQSKAKWLNDAVVTGQKQEMVLDVDKKIFNVENSAMTIGGTAIDVLNQLPTIDIDADGNVSLRGSTDVLIFINGRQTGAIGASPQSILQQIPASNIERVEIINNPSAKYDAEGTSGIINIILKSNKKDGWNALVTGGAGTNHKYNGSASFSSNKGKWNSTITYGFRDYTNWQNGYTYRLNFFEDTSFYVNQNSAMDRRAINHTVNGSTDYQWTKATSVSLSYLMSLSNRRSDEDVWFTFQDGNQSLLRKYLRAGQEQQNGLSGEAGLSFIHNLEGKNHRLTGSLSFSTSQKEEASEFNQDKNGINRQLQRTDNNTFNILPVAQVDYVRPFFQKATFETGVKSTLRDVDDYFYSDTFNFSSEMMEDHKGLTNNFVYREWVNASYVSFASPFKYFSIKAGLRAEHTQINGEQRLGNIPVINDYLSFFPSVFLSKELTKQSSVQLGYSRRIKRPWLGALNPFPEQTDPFNLRIGNPFLNPEFIDAYELTYFARKRADFLSVTTYYRQVNGVMQRVRWVNSEGVATMSWYNLDVSQNAGLEGVLKKSFRYVNATLNLNFFRDQVSGFAQNTDLSAVNYSWNGKLLANTKLHSTLDLQASYFYRGRMTYVQGEIEPMHALDIGLKWTVLDKNGTVSLNLTDMFNTKEFALANYGVNFESNMLRKWETRILTINFSYKLGNLNVDWDKKTRRRGDFDPGDMDM